jgi:hypothetical protein
LGSDEMFEWILWISVLDFGFYRIETNLSQYWTEARYLTSSNGTEEPPYSTPSAFLIAVIGVIGISSEIDWPLIEIRPQSHWPGCNVLFVAFASSTSCP